MEPVYVGIEVAKDRLDVHVRPTGEAFALARDAAGLEALGERLANPRIKSGGLRWWCSKPPAASR